MSVRAINDKTHFQEELTSARNKLVVVQFTANWCASCQSVAPVFQELSNEYPDAVFLKVDIDKCQETATEQGVSTIPNFIFYKNRTKIDRVEGAYVKGPNGLQKKINLHYTST